MNISISTGVFHTKDLLMALATVGRHNVMLEISSEWGDPTFKAFLDNNLEILRGVTRSFHEPYSIEHSAKKGSSGYIKAMDECKKTLEYAQKLNADYMIFHPNNRTLDDDFNYLMKKYSYENLMELNEIAAKHSVSILVENAGILSTNDALYTEDEFITLFDLIENDCQLDIGHMNCNDWNMENVIDSLRGRIRSYHIHNNYGYYDNHNRINDGTIYIPDFVDYYWAYTPDADVVMEYKVNTIRGISDLNNDIYFISECFDKKAEVYTY